MGSVMITGVIGLTILVVMAFIPRMIGGLIDNYRSFQINQAEHRLRLAEIRKSEAETEREAQRALNEQLKS